MKVAVGVFVKTPGHSPIKTRLAAGAGEAAAGEFYELAAVVMRELLLELQAPGDGFEFRPFWAVAETGGMGDARWAELPRVEQGEGPLPVEDLDLPLWIERLRVEVAQSIRTVAEDERRPIVRQSPALPAVVEESLHLEGAQVVDEAEA